MNKFDLDITAVRVPADWNIGSGNSALNEVTALEQDVLNDRLNKEHEDKGHGIFHRLRTRVEDRKFHADSFTPIVTNKPWILGA